MKLQTLLATIIFALVVGVSCSIARAGEFAPTAPERAELKEENYQWGREVNGFQLGIQLQVPGQFIPATKPVPLGTLVMFGLAVRNVSKMPVKVHYDVWMWSISPRVTTEAGEQLPINAQLGLFGNARNGQVFPVTKNLDAGEAIDFGRAWLAVGPPEDKEYRDPVLNVEPGRYRVRYFYDFTPDYHRKSAVTDPKTGDKVVPRKDDEDITSSEIILEIAPAEATKN